LNYEKISSNTPTDQRQLHRAKTQTFVAVGIAPEKNYVGAEYKG
jgi:hypothetical protein